MQEKKEIKKILITSALPYVNNVPHLGNIIGAVLSADVFARFCRSTGKQTLYVCGTDEHGTTTETKAMEEGLTPREVCDKYYKIHKEIYEWFGISFDVFGRSSDPVHHKLTQEIFLRLYEKGLIVPDTVRQFYCKKDDVFLADRFIGGTCPYCGFDDARGDQCERCSKLLEPENLIKPVCKRCGSNPELQETEHLFLDLEKLQPLIEKWAKKRSKEGSWRENAIRITQSWFKEGLTKRCITRDLKWGIEVPLEKYKGKVFYVWFDAPIAYMSMTKAARKDWESWWMIKEEDEKRSDDSRMGDALLYQFMGKDNVPFHSIMFPATLLGTGDAWNTVWHIDSTEYLNYEEGKFSKSRGTGVFGDDVRSTGIPADVWRYYLIAQRPENADSIFLWSDLQSKVNNELIANFANLVNRTLTFISRFYEGAVPEAKVLTEKDKSFIFQSSEGHKKITKLLSENMQREALHEVMEASRLANQYLQMSEPWKIIKEDKAKAGVCLNVLANAVKDLAILIEPFLPNTSKEIFAQLSIDSKSWDDLGNMSVEKGHKIASPKALFAKVEDDQIADFRARFGKKDHNGESTGASDDPFAKLDLRVAKVEDVTAHPDSEKLLLVQISLGDGKRQIVAGLRPFYPDFKVLEGKNIVIAANLEPRKLGGELSQGMLLAAGLKGSDGKEAVIVLDADGAEPGTRVAVEGITSDPAKKLKYEDFAKVRMTTSKGSVVYGQKKLMAGKIFIKVDIGDGARIS